MTKIFAWDNLNSRLTLNEKELLLVKEFKIIFDRDTSPDKERFWREMTYMHLMISWNSPYSNDNDVDRHLAALEDANLTEEELNDPLYRQALAKYTKILNSDLSYKALTAAKITVRRLTDYFENIINLDVFDSEGKPIYKAKDVIAEIKGLPDALNTLKSLEDMIIRNIETDTKLRADAEEGYLPNF